MEFTNNFEVVELSACEIEEIDGGMYQVAAALAAVFGAGFFVGQTIVAAFN